MIRYSPWLLSHYHPVVTVTHHHHQTVATPYGDSHHPVMSMTNSVVTVTTTVI